ncbi:MAG: LysE family translocator [Pseudomonadota bacterium]
MAMETWLAFAFASAVLLAIPGPTVLLVVSYSLGHGWRAALPSVVGVTLGDFVAMTVSMAGLGALLIASSELYTVLRWVGAIYLIYLGIKLWRSPVGGMDALAAPTIDRSSMLRNAFAVTVLNPKALVFFVAFVPQFLDPTAAIFPQAATMVATFVTLAAINTTFYAVVATQARRTIQRPSIQRLVNRVSGSLLVGAGAMTAVYGKSQS